MKTRITELFGIRFPIIQGGMHMSAMPSWHRLFPTPAVERIVAEARALVHQRLTGLVD